MGRGMTCTIEGCDRKHKARGYCDMHYNRWRKHGDDFDRSLPATFDQCSVEGCDNPHYGNSFCSPHNKRFKKHGCPLHGGPLKKKVKAGTADKFIDSLGGIKHNDCIIWPFYKNPQGQMIHRVDGITVTAGRVILERHVGPPPSPNHAALHKPIDCHNQSCCNPNHLRWGTYKENQLDMIKDKTVIRGEDCKSSKLKENQVREIRADNRYIKDIANDYGVSFSLVSQIKRREAWSWLKD